MSGKRQTTMAKLQRERRVAEKRQLKAEKKAARKAGELPVDPSEETVGEVSDEELAGVSGEQPEEISATLKAD
jgi:hypothetical protein